jgi:hypothetical protein
MPSSKDSPYWESERGEIVKYLTLDAVMAAGGVPGAEWTEGAPKSHAEALEVEHFILKLPTPHGDRFYAIHGDLSSDFDLDFEIDRIQSAYAEEFG